MSSSSSSSSSDSSEMSSIGQEMFFDSSSSFENKNNNRHCIENYETVISEYSEKEFIKHFRLRRDVVNQLILQFSQSVHYTSILNDFGRDTTSPEKHMYTFVDHKVSSYRDCADRFDLSLSALFDIITRVSDYLVDIAPQYIRWPNEEERQITKTYFQNVKNFPNIIRCLDGTHIRIDRPKESAESGCLLGDSAYPCLPTLMTSCKDNGHLTAAETSFNVKLSSCRVRVEHTIVILKQRFRFLYHTKLKTTKRRIKVIYAYCVVHNMCSTDDLDLFELEPADKIVNNERNVNNEKYPNNDDLPNEFALKNELRNYLF